MAITTPVDSDGLEWRILLGPTHNWKVPQLEGNKDMEGFCNLCGEPIDHGKPFVTNSAGQQPVHIFCSEKQEPGIVEPNSARRIWAHLVRCFVNG
jgi:hypothetical protein